MAAAKTAKANNQTEAVIGQAAAALNKAVAELKNATSTLDTLEARSEDLTLQVASKQEAIVNLDVEFAEKRRSAEVTLDITLKANAEKVVNEELAKAGKVAISKTELSALNAELATLKADMDKTIKNAEGKAEAMAKSRYESELKLSEATFNAKEAGNVAQIKSLTEKVQFLTEQGAKWEKQLADERSAGVERAKAGAIGSVNLTTAK